MYLRHTLTENEVTKTLRELLGNPQYMAQVSRYKIVLGFPIGNDFYGFSPDACFAYKVFRNVEGHGKGGF